MHKIHYMNIIWFVVMLASISFLTISTPNLVMQTMLSSSASTVSLCVGLCTIYAVWLGFMEIMERSGLADKLTKVLSPVINYLYKTSDKQTKKYLAVNMSANLLGLGSVATPAGIEAMNLLEKENNGILSPSMIMLFVVSSTSLQILPSTVIALREQMNSVNSGDIFLPSFLTTLATTLLGVFIVKIIEKIKIKRQNKICRNI